MNPAELTLIVWGTATAVCFCFSLVLLRASWLDQKAADGYAHDHPDRRSKRTIARAALKLDVLLSLVLFALLLTALGAAFGVVPAVLRVLLTVGTLTVGLAQVCRYFDRRKYDAEQRRQTHA